MPINFALSSRKRDPSSIRSPFPTDLLVLAVVKEEHREKMTDITRYNFVTEDSQCHDHVNHLRTILMTFALGTDCLYLLAPVSRRWNHQ